MNMLKTSVKFVHHTDQSLVIITKKYSWLRHHIQPLTGHCWRPETVRKTTQMFQVCTAQYYGALTNTGGWELASRSNTGDVSPPLAAEDSTGFNERLTHTHTPSVPAVQSHSCLPQEQIYDSIRLRMTRFHRDTECVSLWTSRMHGMPAQSDPFLL